MAKDKFGIGIVGCGTISGTHAEAIAGCELGQLVAAYSRTSANRKPFCDRFDAAGYSDYEEFLANPDLDIVVICTPSGTHLDYGKKAAEAKKHVIVEKPIEVNLERGRSLIKSCRENNVRLAVIYQNRFIDEVVRMKKAIDKGEIGEIFMAEASVKWFRDQQYYDNGGWRGTLALDGGGAVINQAIHTVDLLQWIVGSVESLHAYTGTFTHENIEGEDNAVASLQFSNKAIGTFRASTSIVPPQNRKIEIHGTKGTAILDGNNLTISTSENSTGDGSAGGDGEGASSPLAGMSESHHKKQYNQILNAFRNNEEAIVSGEDSLKSLAVVEGIYRSASDQKQVSIKSLLSTKDTKTDG